MLINWIHRVQASPGAPLNPPTVGKNCPFGMGWRRGTFTDQRIGRSPCRLFPASLRGDRASSEIQKFREGNSTDPSCPVSTVNIEAILPYSTVRVRILCLLDLIIFLRLGSYYGRNKNIKSLQSQIASTFHFRNIWAPFHHNLFQNWDFAPKLAIIGLFCPSHSGFAPW